MIKISSGNGVNKTFTVRKLVDGVGVEKIFPLHSPTIQKIQIVKEGKVRSAKLYYMRDLSGKSARLKENMVEAEIEVPAFVKAAPEAVKEEKSE